MQSPHCAANCLPHVCSCAQSAVVYKLRAPQLAHFICNMSCATWYKRTVQMFCLKAEITYIFSFISLVESSNRRRRERTRIIIIVFRGAIRDFSQFPHSAANCLQHVRSSGSDATCVQITCNTSSAYHVQVSCYVPRGTKGQLCY